MKKRTIFPYQSQELNTIFEEAGNNAKVMCIPIDYAKNEHVVMFCNGHGNILRKPFPIKNSPKGIEYLTQQVLSSCRHRGIDPKYAFFGGEDVGSYAQNFINTLRCGGWIVAGVNAHDAKKQRANAQAGADVPDLMGIASMLLNRRATCSPAQTGIYRNLRGLTRHRKKHCKRNSLICQQRKKIEFIQLLIKSSLAFWMKKILGSRHFQIVRSPLWQIDSAQPRSVVENDRTLLTPCADTAQ